MKETYKRLAEDYATLVERIDELEKGREIFAIIIQNWSEQTRREAEHMRNVLTSHILRNLCLTVKTQDSNNGTNYGWKICFHPLFLWEVALKVEDLQEITKETAKLNLYFSTVQVTLGNVTYLTTSRTRVELRLKDMLDRLVSLGEYEEIKTDMRHTVYEETP